MFIDENSEIDREGLRKTTLVSLQDLKARADHIMYDQDYKSFWNQLHDYCVSSYSEKDKAKYFKLEEQLQNLPKYITHWIEISVDSPERLEFFIASKAEEIQSGNQDHDYFWALQIRHDQLIAVVRVLTKLINCMQEWLSFSITQVSEDPIFQGLLDYDIESQIYLEAEQTHKLRMQHLKEHD